MVHEWLAGHPDVYVPTRRKEVRFFDRHYDRGLGWYAKYFPAENGESYRAIGESRRNICTATSARGESPRPCPRPSCSSC